MDGGGEWVGVGVRLNWFYSRETSPLRLVQLHITKNTVDPRYLDLAYLELPLISKWNSGLCFNMQSKNR